MLAWDYYIIKESKNKFKNWTKAGLEHLRKQYKNLQKEEDRKRVKKILDDLNIKDNSYKPQQLSLKDFANPSKLI